MSERIAVSSSHICANSFFTIYVKPGSVTPVKSTIEIVDNLNACVTHGVIYIAREGLIRDGSARFRVVLVGSLACVDPVA